MNKYRRDQFQEKQSKIGKDGVEYVFVHDKLTGRFTEMTRAEFNNLKNIGRV